MEKTSNDSQDGIFKLPKYKMVVRPEVLMAIKFHAKHNMDNLYDDRFDEDQMGGGYHAFKELVLLQNPLPKSIDDYAFGQPGFYLLQRLHVLIRQRAIDCARDIRKTFKIYQDE